MASKDELPNFTVSDYVKFFAAGALAATSTHGVSFHQLTPSRLTSPRLAST